jgi:hypothetical protein
MDNLKTLFWIVLSMGCLVAIWWFGWFRSVTETLLEIKRLTTHD